MHCFRRTTTALPSVLSSIATFFILSSLACVALFFVVNRAIPATIASLAPLFLFLLFGIAASDDVAKAYVDDIIDLVLGSFILAGCRTLQYSSLPCSSVNWFYGSLCSGVTHWVTINEVNAFALGGYDDGILPPNRCPKPFGNCAKGNSVLEPYIVAHHILLAHSLAASLYKKYFQVYRATGMGDYPKSMRVGAGNKIPRFTNSESKQLMKSFDLFGVNYYVTLSVKNKPYDALVDQRDITADVGASLEGSFLQQRKGNSERNLIHGDMETILIVLGLGFHKTERDL